MVSIWLGFLIISALVAQVTSLSTLSASLKNHLSPKFSQYIPKEYNRIRFRSSNLAMSTTTKSENLSILEKVDINGDGSVVKEVLVRGQGKTVETGRTLYAVHNHS